MSLFVRIVPVGCCSETVCFLLFASALTLFDRLEIKLQEHPGQLLRACVELAKVRRLGRRNHLFGTHAFVVVV